MFNADIDALGEDLSAVTLVDDHSQGVLCDVVDASGLSVICLEWHALVNGTVALKTRKHPSISQFTCTGGSLAHLNIDVVSGFVDTHVS